MVDCVESHVNIIRSCFRASGNNRKRFNAFNHPAQRLVTATDFFGLVIGLVIGRIIARIVSQVVDRVVDCVVDWMVDWVFGRVIDRIVSFWSGRIVG